MRTHAVVYLSSIDISSLQCQDGTCRDFACQVAFVSVFQTLRRLRQNPCYRCFHTARSRFTRIVRAISQHPFPPCYTNRILASVGFYGFRLTKYCALGRCYYTPSTARGFDPQTCLQTTWRHTQRSRRLIGDDTLEFKSPRVPLIK